MLSTVEFIKLLRSKEYFTFDVDGKEYKDYIYDDLFIYDEVNYIILIPKDSENDLLLISINKDGLIKAESFNEYSKTTMKRIEIMQRVFNKDRRKNYQ